MKQIEKYLGPTSGIDCDNVVIKQRAEDITRGQETSVEKAITLFYWVRDQIKYTPIVPDEIFDDYKASDTLGREKGFCVEKASCRLFPDCGHSGPSSSGRYSDSSYLRETHGSHANEPVCLSRLL